jgi:hypothetical protein
MKVDLWHGAGPVVVDTLTMPFAGVLLSRPPTRTRMDNDGTLVNTVVLNRVDNGLVARK